VCVCVCVFVCVFTNLNCDTGAFKASCLVMPLESRHCWLVLNTQKVQIHSLQENTHTHTHTHIYRRMNVQHTYLCDLMILFVVFLCLTQVSLHLQPVGDSVNEKLVDIRHNTPDLPQSDMCNTHHHFAVPSSHRTTQHDTTCYHYHGNKLKGILLQCNLLMSLFLSQKWKEKINFILDKEN